MPRTSRYTIVVDNLSTVTRTADIEYEFKYAGPIRDIIKDAKARCALVEFDRSSDAEYAYRKMHGMMLHGRKLKVDMATREDFKLFGWKWTEYSPSPSPKRGRSRSRSTSRSRSRSPSESRGNSRGRNKSPPATPNNKDGKYQTHSPEERGDDGK